MEVIHEDYLDRSVSNTGSKKEYKKAYFVFRKNSAGSKTLEYFKDSNWRKSEPRGVCNLFNGYAADIYDLNASKKKFGLKLTTVDKTFELYANSEAARDKWLDVLNEDLITFHRTAILESPPNAYAIVRLLTGQLHLQVTDCAVVLLSNRMPQVTWRFHTIRRYKSRDGAFVLEVGRKAPTGEGVFRFQVPDPNKLFDELDVALKNRIKQKRNEESLVCGSRRTFSFNEDSSAGWRQMPQRSESVEDRALPVSPSEYSSLDIPVIGKLVPDKSGANGYDTLFADSLLNGDNTELPAPIGVFDNTKVIGRNSTKNNTNQKPEHEVNYIDMSGMKDEIIKESKNVSKYPEIKPRPLPRSKTTTEIICTDSTAKSTVMASPLDTNNKSHMGTTGGADLIDFNTYDRTSITTTTTTTTSSSSSSKASPRPCTRSNSDYSYLNKHHKTLEPSDTSSYDHLNHSFGNKPSESLPYDTHNRRSWDDTYDSPKTYVNDTKADECDRIYCNGDAGRNQQTKPVRPLPPARRPRRGSDRANSCEVLPDTVLVLGKCSNQTNIEAFYDTPRETNLVNGHIEGRKVGKLNVEDLPFKNQKLKQVPPVPPRT